MFTKRCCKKGMLTLILFLFVNGQVFASEVEKTAGKVKFGKGVANQSVSFQEGDYLHYNAEKSIKGNAGTVELWVKPFQPSVSIEFEPLISIGNNSPSWFLISLSKGKLGFLYKKGQKPFKGEEEFYTSVSVDVKEWKENEWHHLAFLWANIGKGKSVIQIYVDGALKEARYNCSVGEEFDTPLLGIGFNTAAAAGPRFSGEIDELRISNYPKTGKEITESYKRGIQGEPLIVEDGTLLLLHFDGTTTGISKTDEKIPEEKIKSYVEAILKEID